jgi:integrase
MATIEPRGPHQFPVKVRRHGVSQTKTFESHRGAEDWARILDGKVSGDDFVDRSRARDTALSQALDWYQRAIVPKTPRSSSVKLSLIAYWRTSRFADWSLVLLHPWDLLEWRREVLDEDSAEGGAQVGPDANFGVQSCIHRLNLISDLYGQWSLIQKSPVDNPVVRGVRPILGDGRERRLDPQPDDNGKTEEDRLYAACDASKSTWLGAAVRIAIETGLRQAELAGLTFERLHLDGPYPHVDLLRTKKDRHRRVPLSTRAVKAFKSLLPEQKHGIAKHKVLSIESPRAIGHAFRAVIKEAEFPDLRWHDLRHEAVSRLFQNTDLRDNEIIAISGHLSTEMLKRYSHLRSHRLASRLG